MGTLKNSVAAKCGFSLGSALFDETKTDQLASSSCIQNIFCRNSSKSVKKAFLLYFNNICSKSLHPFLLDQNYHSTHSMVDRS